MQQTQAVGNALHLVLTNFSRDMHAYGVECLVGHDVVSDVTLLVNEAVRCALSPSTFLPVRRLICTKLASIGLCAIPLHGAGGAKMKWPKLTETYRHCGGGADTDEDIAPANHDARHDVRRCGVIIERLMASDRCT